MPDIYRQAKLFALSNIVLQRVRPELLIKPDEVCGILGLDKTNPADVEYAIEIIDALGPFILEKWDLKDDY